MVRVAFGVLAAVISLSIILWLGDRPERRYEGSPCQYRMIYGTDENDRPMGLVTLGGSRVLVATKADHFNQVLKVRNSDALPVHNMAHSHFSLEKEYVLLRDLLEVRRPKAALVMIEPRYAGSKQYGKVHPDYVEIARLSDIPYAVRALWPEDRLAAVAVVRDILWEHFRFFDRVKNPPRGTTSQNCYPKDHRLNVDQIWEGYRLHQKSKAATLQWDLTAPDGRGFLRQIAEFKKLSEHYGMPVIFILMTGSGEPLPERDFDLRFESVTGMKLIILDEHIQAALTMGGRRDRSHINHKGREMFLPWLIDQIEKKCHSSKGCF